MYKIGYEKSSLKSMEHFSYTQKFIKQKTHQRNLDALGTGATSPKNHFSDKQQATGRKEISQNIAQQDKG